MAAAVTSVDTAAPAWTSPTLDGQLYGQPLVYAGRVYVATENDTVYALAAATGKVAWSAHLGSPVQAGSLPCGDIRPVAGITGTPVIDPARNEIFVVADEMAGGSPAHRLFGLSTASGRVEMSQDVDPPGAVPADLLQRTGLTLDAGQVVFGMGGNDGDCAVYRGQVVAVPETGGTPKFFTVDAASGESQGAVWMGGAAPVVDSRGDVWVSTGNGSVYSYQHPYDDSDAVLELSSSMRLLQYFAPSTWATNNSQDLDMSVAPALLPDGQVVLAGKSRIVYLLNGADLGGIGRRAGHAGRQRELHDGIGLQRRHRRRRRRGGHDGLPALPGRHHRGPGHAVPARAAPAVELGHRRRPARGGGRPGLDHGPERHPVRARPGHRAGPAAGHGRRARQPLPHPGRGRRPPAGHQLRPGGRVRRVRPGPAGRGDGADQHAGAASSAAASSRIGIIALVALAVIVGGLYPAALGGDRRA